MREKEESACREETEPIESKPIESKLVEFGGAAKHVGNVGSESIEAGATDAGAAEGY